MIGALERQIITLDHTGGVLRGRIIERIRTTLKVRIEKEWRKSDERIERYFNNKHALRQNFGINQEMDG